MFAHATPLNTFEHRFLTSRPAMKVLTAAALLLVLALASPARSAIDDAACVNSLASAVMDYECQHYDDKFKYTCPRKECKEILELVAQVCLAEGYRLADQVVAAAKAMEAEGSSSSFSSSGDASWANATANNV